MDEGADGWGKDADLLAVGVAAALVAVSATVPGVRETPLRILLGVPFVLLVPGYALAAALFPEGEADGWLGWLPLSVGGSVVAVTAVSLALEVTWGFEFGPVLAGLLLLTVGAVGVAWVRRGRPTRPSAFAVDFRRVLSVIGGGSALSVVLTLVVVATAVGAVGVVLTEPTESATVTELYVLGERPDGTLSAGAYPTNLTVGEPATYVVGAGTEGERFDGTIVVTLRQAAPDGGVQGERSLVDRFAVDIDAGESRRIEHAVTPQTVGTQRLTYRLYRGDPASNPAVREVHVWVDVAESSGNGTADAAG
ncbi:DUF1616 domain-containing protein [Halapricum sp. CBA1109]|uniref:DUF1616 domain-containing protein n=1 Tax=Halapricum sp. CBA1109 TaxID=2668068 RepID=UPI0018D26C8F|nr:DUF1616 domain-containing protein [Halapricum sp. CBA1109]